MDRIRTYIALIVVTFAQLAPAAAMPFSPSQRIELFATCAGLYSALADHQRLFDGEASEETMQIAQGFTTLIDAVMPDAKDYGMPGKQALAWQVQAKMNQVVLLNEATLHTDERRSERARLAAEANLMRCEGLILSS